MVRDWINRLENWKFRDALEQVPDQHPMREHDDYETLMALNEMFGNCGHFEGWMGNVVSTAAVAITERWKGK